MEKKRRSTSLGTKIEEQENLTIKNEKYTTILRSGLESRSSTRRSIVKEDIKIDDSFDIPRLIEQRKYRLMKNGLFISTIKAAMYLLRNTILNNWTDSTLVLIRYILSSFLLIIVTPLFVPRILRTYTVTSSLRLSVIGMSIVTLTTYRPFPFIFMVQIFLSTLPESVLNVVVPLYMVRIAKIWSRISSIDLNITVLRLFALENFLYHLSHVFVATVEYIQTDIPDVANLLDVRENSTCGIDYCDRTSQLIASHVYDVKIKNLDISLIILMSLAIIATALTIVVGTVLDRLETLSKSELGDQPTTCKAIDVFLQLCRPRMSYLVGISLYHPFMRTLREDYLEAYGNCILARKHDHVTVIVVSIIAMYAILSAEILVDLFGMVGSIQLALGIMIATFAVLSFCGQVLTISIISIFIVFYVIEYWTLIYGIFVALATQQLIGDQEIAAWGIHTTIFYAGLTLSQAFRYFCMRTKFHIMIVFGIIVLLMTHFLRIEIKNTLVTTLTKSTIIDDLHGKNKMWFTDSSANLDKVIDDPGQILWIETFWRRTVNVVSHPIDFQLCGVSETSKERKRWCSLFEKRAEHHDGNG